MVNFVDVSWKPPTRRRAQAKCVVNLSQDTIALLKAGKLPKGDAISTAKIAAILAAKNTANIVPLCHNIPIEDIDIKFELLDSQVLITTEVCATAKTGVEMEALVSCAAAALTIYDMCKAVDKQIVIENLKLAYKTGGISSGAIYRTKTRHK